MLFKKRKFLRILNRLGENFVSQLQNDIRTGGKYPHIAKGDLLNSFQFKIERRGGNFSLRLEAEESFDFIEGGRPPGSGVHPDILEDWMKAKSIPIEYAYPINEKIKRQGIAPKKYLQNYLQESDDKALQQLAKALKSDLEEEMSEAIKQLNEAN